MPRKTRSQIEKKDYAYGNKRKGKKKKKKPKRYYLRRGDHVAS